MGKTTREDDANADFVVRENVVQHKPGIDLGEEVRDGDKEGNNQFKRSDPKAIPKGTLAERFAAAAKGG